MRVIFVLLAVLLSVASCKSIGEKCGGCALRYCDEAPDECDCGCFDGDVVNGAVCKGGCFERKPQVDCSKVGCAPPPLCSTGCTETCGCCSCADGTVQGGLKCMGGCYVPMDMM
jgi:hypothetical protein